MKDLDLEYLLPRAEAVVRDAGEIIMKFYRGGAKSSVKADGSFVTEADHAAEALILSRLEELTPGVPVVSEEAAEGGAHPDLGGGTFWIADPLDGTSNFINKKGQFLVALALVVDHRVALGVVYDPVEKTMYSGAGPGTASKTDRAGSRVSLAAHDMAGDPRILVNDSSVNVPAVESWLRSQFNSAAFKPDKRGTNVRALAVTTGEADVTVVYPKRREGRTKWWDVAPAHAIVEAAGGRVEGLDGKAVRYDAEDYQVPQLVITAKREAGLDTLRRGMMPPSKTHDHRRLD